MSRTLRNIFNYSRAPLVQWEPAIGEPLSEGKAHEDALIYPQIAAALDRQGARAVTGIIADEARLELHLAHTLTGARALVHLTLEGAFETAALHNAAADARPSAQKVSVTTDVDAIAPRSQDAVILNMILGCVSTQDDHANFGALVRLAASYVAEDGSLVLVRPNPAGQDFSTYACLTPANDLKGGKDYDFIVKGLESLGAMKNIHTPDDFVAAALTQEGMKMGRTRGIADTRPSAAPPFLINVCKFSR